MSLSSSLSNAMSGLFATRRATELVSSNIANAATDGFGRRELLLSARSLDGAAGGVMVEGVRRVSDPWLVADRRGAGAAAGRSDLLAGAMARIEDAFGLPGAPGALTTRVDRLETALIDASAQPESGPRLRAVLSAAQDLVSGIGAMSDTVQDERRRADAAIASEVETLNASLSRIAEVNARVLAAGQSGQRDVTGLLDERARLVDRVSEIVPVREIPREGGQIALYSETGGMILDGQAREIAFTEAGAIGPGMTPPPGALSGLSRDGEPLATEGEFSPVAGGRLAALFEIRDRLAPAAQAGLDAFARDLVERFQDPGLDPSLGAGAAGLFTDAGGAFAPADEVGLSGRLEVNAAADPAEGGDLWRLRAGLGAAGPGDPGDTALLDAMAARLDEGRAPASGPAAGRTLGASALAADLVSGVATARQVQEAESGYQTARLDALRGEEARAGVDTDAEMQKLLLIEQAWAANAKVLQTVDDLLEQLVRI